MLHFSNPICRACSEAYNQVNGRYCLPLQRMVEYAPRPLCKTNSKQQPNNETL